MLCSNRSENAKRRRASGVVRSSPSRQLGPSVYNRARSLWLSLSPHCSRASSLGRGGVLDDDEGELGIAVHHDLVVFAPDAEELQRVLRVQVAHHAPRHARQLRDELGVSAHHPALILQRHPVLVADGGGAKGLALIVDDDRAQNPLRASREGGVGGREREGARRDARAGRKSWDSAFGGTGRSSTRGRGPARPRERGSRALGVDASRTRGGVPCAR